MSKISVLHISTADNAGGSGRSAYKIHRVLREEGIESKMLVRRKVTADEDVALIRRGLLKLADKAVSAVTEELGLQYLFLPSSRRLLDHPWYKQADVVQLYNTHGNYFSHAVLPAISREKTIVWRLSDMWPMTGHCAYPGNCEKWKTGCHQCPDLNSYPRLKRDTASLLWRRKEQLYQQSKIHLVAPSQWICDIAQESPLLTRFPKSIIHNGIDCDLFQTANQEECRRKLEIHHQGQGILFIADDVRDPRKGSSLFSRAIHRLWSLGKRDIFVMLVGGHASDWQVDLPCPVWRHESIDDDRRLAFVYNAASVVIHPALVENLPNSILEAMACGRPSVAFDVGGVSEVVQHLRTGCLAPLGDVDAIAQGALWILSDEARRKDLSLECRQRIQRDFSLQGQAQAFASLYQKLVSERRRAA